MPIVLLTLILTLNQHSFGQTTIWEEDFEGLDVGDQQGTGTPPKWTISPIADYTEYFDVQSIVGNLIMEGKNMDQEGILTTQPIDISSYSNVTLSVSVSEVGDMEGTDYIKIYYQLEGGEEILFAVNGNLVDDFEQAIAGTSVLTGASVIIIIKVKNNAAAEHHRIEYLLVQGIPIIGEPLSEFRSRKSGNWDDSETWEQKFSNNIWENTSEIPESLPSGSVYPVVDGTAESEESSNTNLHKVALPINVESEDLLLIFWTDGQKSGASVTMPVGWSEIYAVNYNDARYYGWYKISDGNEGSEVIVLTNYINKSAHNSYRIAKGTYSDIPVACIKTGSSASPDPPIFTSGFGAIKTLWIIASHSSGDDNDPEPTAPDEYTGYFIKSNYMDYTLAHPVRMLTSRRELETATENPGSFTLGSSVDWAAVTVAVQGAREVPATSATILDNHLLTVTENTSIDMVIIESLGAMTVNRDFTLSINEGIGTGLLVKSAIPSATGSLIIYGNLVDNSNSYIERMISDQNWHIISSPVLTQNISGFAVAYANEYASDDYDLAPYNVGNNSWGPYVTSSTTGNLDVGKGYVIRRKTTLNTITFSGTINYGTIPSTGTITVSDAGYGWNCLGNPYTSSIWASSFLSTHSEQLNPTYAGIYLWDGSATTPDYKVITNDMNLNFPDGDGNYLEKITQGIAPGQGFIVRAKSGGGQIDFSPSMQFHASTSDPAPFKSAEISTPAIRLTVSGDEMVNTAIVSFEYGMTNGLDPSYDVGKLKGNPDLALYTKLVDGSSSDVDFAIQALPDISAEKVRIPVGLDFPVGGEITFSLEMSSGFPADVNVYLEDTQIQELKKLNLDNAKYTTTVDAETKGTGRFNLVFGKNSTTGICKPVAENNFTVFTRDKNIFINGPATNNTRFAVYSVNGKMWFNTLATQLNQNRIDGSCLPAGVYLLKIENTGQTEKPVKFVIH
ncbi:MAG: T9SS type A sorting domain-containing protein [Draconibacterium sp.]|nr:T9SS type A sorting domain-containing protein [Draconibacterium sp.]